MPIQQWKDRLQVHFREVLKTKHGAHSIAIGFAIGTLIAILPTPGIGIILGTLIVLVFKKISKIALFAALLLWNPLVLVPLYYLSYKLGIELLGSTTATTDSSWGGNMFHSSTQFLLGNALLALSIAIISYTIIYAIISIRQQQHKQSQRDKDK